MPVASVELIARGIVGQIDSMMEHKRGTGMESASWPGAPLVGLNHGAYITSDGRLKITERGCTMHGLDESVAEGSISERVLSFVHNVR